MFKGIIASFLIFCGSFFNGGYNRDRVECRLKNGHSVYVKQEICKKLHGKWNLPSVTPTPTNIPSPTLTPSVSPTLTPTPTLSPTPTPNPVQISGVSKNYCSAGSSCSGYLTGVDVTGSGFAVDSRVKLVSGITEYSGNYMGGDGSTQIITDFVELPHCTTFDTVVFGSTGTATSANSITSLCP